MKDKIYFLALMTALATSLYFIEMLLPKPLPFIKIGFSNIIILLLVYNRIFRFAIFTTLLKSVIGSFATGTLLTPTFLLSFSGGLSSCLFMIIFTLLLQNLSIVGLSIIGAFSHLLMQLLVVKYLIIKSNNILLLYPIIAVLSIITGIITGMVAAYFNKSLDLRSLYAKSCT